MSMLPQITTDYTPLRAVYEDDPRDLWPSWTTEDRWTIADDLDEPDDGPEPPYQADPVDLAYALGHELGETEGRPFHQFLAAGASDAERKAFFEGLKAGYSAKVYAYHRARFDSGIALGRRMRESEIRQGKPTGITEADVYRSGGVS